MRRLNNIVFSLRLAWSIAVFGTRVALGLAAQKQLTTLTIVTLLLAGLFATTTLVSKPREMVESAPVLNHYLYQGSSIEKLSDKEVEERLSYVLKQLEIQPTHQDLIYNAALLYRAQGNESKAKVLLDQLSN